MHWKEREREREKERSLLEIQGILPFFLTDTDTDFPDISSYVSKTTHLQNPKKDTRVFLCFFFPFKMTAAIYGSEKEDCEEKGKITIKGINPSKSLAS